jgi:hypothetical protein
MRSFNSFKATLMGTPWFYFLISIYPLLFLWVYNKTQIDPAEVIRPLIITIISSGILFFILYFIFREFFKAGLFGTLLLILFFSYGQVYYWIRNLSGDVTASRHRILIIVYAILLLAGTWLVVKWWSKLKRLKNVLNFVSLILVILPIIQLCIYYISISAAVRQLTSEPSIASIPAKKDLPDIYFILLDTYMRSDAMLQDLGYDNSAFINELRQKGFYVADCSRPNYDSTEQSLITTFNMNYLSDLISEHPNLADNNFYGVYIKNSEVRKQLDKLGYITVAFRTGYTWTEIENANVFLGLDRSPISSKYVHPFEEMYLKSTAGLLIIDINAKLHISQYFLKKNFAADNPNLPAPDFPYQGHVKTALFVLDQLPNVVSITGPKFVFAHIMVPHQPYVFAPDGSLLTDPGYWSGDFAGPINSEFRRKGYISSVQFINNRILPILGKIISDSNLPPIIVLEGDHGLIDHNRNTNLLAFYLPDGYEALYPSITSVNSLRLIMDEYVGADYPLLPDISYDLEGKIAPETYPGCMH